MSDVTSSVFFQFELGLFVRDSIHWLSAMIEECTVLLECTDFLGLREPPVAQFSSAEHKIWFTQSVSAVRSG